MRVVVWREVVCSSHESHTQVATGTGPEENAKGMSRDGRDQVLITPFITLASQCIIKEELLVKGYEPHARLADILTG